MIARPLDLASKLRPAPRAFDALFYVNVGLLVFFFTLFGSRFVLTPGLGLDFRLPALVGARAGASATSCHISILRSGQIFTEAGLLDRGQLPAWLQARVHRDRDREPALLIRASDGVTLAEITDLQTAARAAGFIRVVIAAEEPSHGG